MKGCSVFVTLMLMTLPGATPALAAGPYVEVAPNQVANGQTANVFGTGFCPTGGGCSSVSIAVESKQVATVAVDSAGKFHTTFVVSEFPGSHPVYATQSANGATLSARTGMTVQLMDSRNSPPPSVVTPPVEQPPASPPATGGALAPPPPTASGLPPPTNQPVADASSGPQTGVTPIKPVAPEGAKFPSAWLMPLTALLVVLAAATAWFAWRRRPKTR